MRHLRKDYDRFQDPEGKIPPEEPVFLLRGQDLCAPAAVRAWARNAERAGADHQLVQEAIRWAGEMQRWGRIKKHGPPDVPAGQLRHIKTREELS